MGLGPTVLDYLVIATRQAKHWLWSSGLTNCSFIYNTNVFHRRLSLHVSLMKFITRKLSFHVTKKVVILSSWDLEATV
jgi:hypothetical protein